jgi:2-oxoglutarate ferredoxin oxidoreductase subunit delta
MRYWRRPLDFDRMHVPHGAVRIVTERCKGCGFCVEYCPKGYHPPKVVKASECVNCNLCEMICPEFAIFSVPLEESPCTLSHQAS